MSKINRVEIDGDMVVIVRGNTGYVYNSKIDRINRIKKLISNWKMEEKELFFHSVSGEKSSVGKVQFYTNPEAVIDYTKEIYYVRGNINRNVILSKANQYPHYMEYTELLLKTKEAY